MGRKAGILRRKVLPDNCKHKRFFKCKNPSKCIGCYYNPIEEEALSPVDADDDPRPYDLWFYRDSKFATEMLKEVEEILAGKGKFTKTLSNPEHTAYLKEQAEKYAKRLEEERLSEEEEDDE